MNQENITDTSGGQNIQDPFKDDQKKLEKIEEEKLKMKYPNLGRQPRAAGSQLLQKRLQKGMKYFDSGDYNMAKANAKNKKIPMEQKVLNPGESTGETIPTPENVPVRKTSINTHPPLTGPQAGILHPAPASHLH